MALDNYTVETQGPWTLYLRKEYKSALLAAGVGNPKALVAKGAKPITSRGRAMVAFVPFDGGRMAVREYRHGGMFRFFTGGIFLTDKRPKIELEVLEHAYKAGVRVPEPLGAAVKKGILGYRAYLYTRVIDEAVDFVHYLSRPNPPLILEWRAVTASAAEEVRKMHDSGIIHGDLHVKNLLVIPPENPGGYMDSEMVQPDVKGGKPGAPAVTPVEKPKVFIIDFDKSRVVDEVPMADRERNLMRLGRSVDKLKRPLRVSRSDMLRLFRKYMTAGPDLPVDEKEFATKFAAERSRHKITRKLPGQKDKL